MRKILFIAGLLIISGCSSVQRIPDGAVKDDNQAMMDFIDSSFGGKIGQGVCLEFVIEAMKHKWDSTNQWGQGDLSLEQLKKHAVHFNTKKKNFVKNLRSGDIILILGGAPHIGIVYALDIHYKYFVVAEQNSVSEDMIKINYMGEIVEVCKDSKVGFSRYDKSELEEQKEYDVLILRY